jgi:hypothetical protein
MTKVRTPIKSKTPKGLQFPAASHSVLSGVHSLLGRDAIDSIMVSKRRKFHSCVQQFYQASGLNEKGKGRVQFKSGGQVAVKLEELEQNGGTGKGKRHEIDEVDHRCGKRLRLMSGTRMYARLRCSVSDHVYSEDVKIKQEDMEGTIGAAYATCGICMDAFQPTYSPYTASLSANSSSRLQFGLRLPCPQQHAYCVGCLTSYIEMKLDPEGKGGGNSGIIVFPIRCPECPITDYMDGIPDDIAGRVLGPEKMVLWVCSQVIFLALYRRT